MMNSQRLARLLCARHRAKSVKCLISFHSFQGLRGRNILIPVLQRKGLRCRDYEGLAQVIQLGNWTTAKRGSQTEIYPPESHEKM